jgi:probable F420-dependent oxidoreductase
VSSPEHNPSAWPTRPFRFVVTTTGAADRAGWAAQVREVEQLGYAGIMITDHVHQELAPLVALAYAADVSSTLRLGTYVLGNDFRVPVVLAKELATVDILSEGRLDVGVGAGWLESDYAQLGVPFDRGAVRVERFCEAVTILKAVLGGERLSFSGRYYDVETTDCGARAVQVPHPPILVGASRRALISFAASVADIVSITPSVTGLHAATDLLPSSMDTKIQWLRKAAGTRIGELEVNHVVWECLVTPRSRSVAVSLAGSLDVTPEEVFDVPTLLLGSVDEIVDQLHRRRERWGVSLVTIPLESMRSFAPVVERMTGK